MFPLSSKVKSEFFKLLSFINNAVNTLQSALEHLPMVNITPVTASDIHHYFALYCVQPRHLREVLRLGKTEQTLRWQADAFPTNPFAFFFFFLMELPPPLTKYSLI